MAVTVRRKYVTFGGYLHVWLYGGIFKIFGGCQCIILHRTARSQQATDLYRILNLGQVESRFNSFETRSLSNEAYERAESCGKQFQESAQILLTRLVPSDENPKVQETGWSGGGRACSAS